MGVWNGFVTRVLKGPVDEVVPVCGVPRWVSVTSGGIDISDHVYVCDV